MEFIEKEQNKKFFLNQLIDFVKYNGGYVGDIEFKEDAYEGFGIFAAGHIGAEDKLLSIPYRLCISVDLILNSPLKQIIDDNNGLLAYPDEILALGLVYSVLHEGDECIWKKHVRTLPNSFNSTIFWTESELFELKNCTVFHLTNMMKKQIQSDWESIHEPIFRQYPSFFTGATIEHYIWALSIIYSRAVGITRNGVYIRCIPPVLDMANHNPEISLDPDDTFAYDAINDHILFLNSCKNKSTGEECYALYGKYPNAKLALSYGFVIPNCPHKAIDLWTKLQPTAYEYTRKQDILQSNPLTNNQTYEFLGTIRENWISPALLATIRIIQISNFEELQNYEKAFYGHLISVRNEKATYVSLRNLIINRMDAEKAESDKQRLGNLLLADTDRNNRELMALVIRVEERELLQNAVAMVNEWLERIETEGEQFLPFDHIIIK